MIKQQLSLLILCAAATAAPLAAQTTARGTCTAAQAIGFIGISGVDCNCTIGSSSPEQWAFRTEPRITSLEMDTRGGQLLKIGDVITHVNGTLITTRDGARAFASIKPGQPVVLTVRRNGEQLRFALTPEAVCPDDSRSLGIYAPRTPTIAAPRPMAPSAASRVPAPRSAPTSRSTAAFAATQRGSFGFGLMCSGNCEIRAEASGALHFSQAPEVYSVERGSNADKAGIRRGDIITHVNGQSITSKAGGRTFGTAKPGQTLRFTIRRGGSSRSVSLTATASNTAIYAPTADLTKSSESLERARHSLRELQREQAEQMSKIQEELRRSKTTEEESVRALQREFYRQEQEHRRKLGEVSNELTRAEQRMRAALADSARNSCAVASAAPRAGSSRTLRYTGLIGETEVEVRGPQPVTVTEHGDRVTISAGGTQITVTKAKK